MNGRTMGPTLSRRSALKSAASLAAVGGLSLGARADESDDGSGSVVTKGRIKQSACRWCYSKIELDTLAEAASSMGLVGLDLMTPGQFPTLKKYGLICTMTSSHGLQDGLCEPANHEDCLAKISEAIDATAKEGWKNVICFSGNRRGIDDKTGLENCARALRQIVPQAEQAGVVVQMELLNSKVNHPDYMCDRSEWGADLVQKVGSDNFKLLYDIYHMQIMEGDVIRTIRTFQDAFGHYHTGGNPGRNEIDDSQELNYKPIAEAILETGFDGYFAHEFIPKRDPLTSLAEAVALCDI